jgi:hypothetical protein
MKFPMKMRVWELLQQYGDDNCVACYKDHQGNKLRDEVHMRELLSEDEPYTSFWVNVVLTIPPYIFIDLDSKVLQGFEKPE